MLIHPRTYKRIDHCGCGADSAAFDYVPDTLFGLDITEACCIHDFMYMEGKSQKDKDRADRVFLENMLTLIEEDKPGFIRWLRKHKAWLYYRAVHKFGGKSFWEGKDHDFEPR